MLSRHVALMIGALGMGVLALQAEGAIATEYFNGYGTAGKSLGGLNGGSGWTDVWAGDTLPSYITLSNNSAYNLTYTSTGYYNTGNKSTLSDGAAMSGGGTAGNVATRSLRVGTTADTGLTGTIWASVLMTSGSSTSSDALLWLDRPDNSTANFVGLRSLSAKLRYNGTDISGPANAYAINTTYLYLVKVVMNAGGTTNDTVSLWVNPNLSGGEAGLGTPTLSGANNANVFGNAFSGIGISFGSFGKLDSIRISNESTGFTDVTMVPEPAIGLLALGALGLLTPRRRTA